ncbi:DUF5720 family protein [Faecalicatena orotica]
MFFVGDSGGGDKFEGDGILCQKRFREDTAHMVEFLNYRGSACSGKKR